MRGTGEMITEKNTNLKDAAIELAEMGFSVIPVAEMGKVPRIKWAKYQDQAADTDQIETWWDDCPNANIGIVTGDVVVIDCDTMDAARWVADNITPTPWAVRTARGAHFYFKATPGTDWRNGANVRAGVDVRAAGGFVVAPPSIHETGHVYEWHRHEGADSLDELPTLSGDDRAKLYSTEQATTPVLGYDGRPVSTGQRNQSAASMAGKCYARGYTPQQALEYLRDWNARNMPALPDSELQTVAESVWRTHEKNRAKNGAVVIDMAAAGITGQAPTEAKSKRAQPAPRIDLDLAIPRGEMMDLFQFTNANGRMNAPILTLAATLTAYASLVGRNYESEGGNRANLMTLAIAPTGAGKDAARQAIKKLFAEHGADRILGADDFASASAIVKRLTRHPRALFMVDEFGHFLTNIQHKNASANRQEIRSVLMKLYSDNKTIFKFKEYATETTPTVNQPHVCLYGTTTPEPLFDSLTPESIRDGFLNRFLMFYHPRRVKREGQPRHADEAPQHLAHLVREAADYGGISVGNMADLSPLAEHRPRPVHTTKAAFDCMEELDNEFQRRQDSGDIYADLWARSCENANKLALLHAISRDPKAPRIETADAEFGAYLARYSCELMTWAAIRYMSEGAHDKNRQKVIDAIRALKAPTKSVLLRRLRSLKAAQINEIIEELHLANEIILKIEEGKPTAFLLA